MTKTSHTHTIAAFVLACGPDEPAGKATPPTRSIESEGQRPTLEEPAPRVPQVDPPVEEVEVVALPAVPLRAHLTAGAAHACLLHDGGRITCWGDNQKGQLGAIDDSGVRQRNVPGIDDAVGVVAGGDLTCAWRRSGEVSCWGELGRAHVPHAPSTVPGIDDAVEVEIAHRGAQACARRASGRGACWSDWDEPRPVVGLSRAVDLAVGSGRACAAIADGTIRCWREDGRATEYGVANFEHPPSFREPGITDAVEVAYINEGSVPSLCARPRAGGVRCSDNIDRLGPRDDIMREIPAPFLQVEGVSGAVALAGSGTSHACALLDDGAVACWGSNLERQLGRDTERVDGPFVGGGAVRAEVPSARAVATGNHSTCAVTDDDVRCWGERSPMLTPGTPPFSSIEGIEGAEELASAGLTHCARHGSGRISCWGYVLGGRNEIAFTPIVHIDRGATRLWAGSGQACARRADGVSCWGRVTTSEGLADIQAPRRMRDLPADGELVLHFSGVCRRDADGRLGCPADGPPPELASRPIIKLFAGSGCAALGAQVDCWSWQRSPTSLTLPAPVTQVTVGSVRACALSGGEIACWEGPSVHPERLARPDGVRAFTQLAASEHRVCGLTDRRRALCWSSAPGGRLGPAEDPTGLDDLVEITAADDSFCARRAGGTVVCWGKYELRGIEPFVGPTPISTLRVQR